MIKELVQATFPDHVMSAIGSDHHKSRDGILRIVYDYYSNERLIDHPGYIREASGSGESLETAIEMFMKNIEKENKEVLHRYELNKLGADYDYNDGVVSLYDENGEVKTVGSYQVIHNLLTDENNNISSIH